MLVDHIKELTNKSSYITKQRRKAYTFKKNTKLSQDFIRKNAIK